MPKIGQVNYLDSVLNNVGIQVTIVSNKSSCAFVCDRYRCNHDIYFYAMKSDAVTINKFIDFVVITKHFGCQDSGRRIEWRYLSGDFEYFFLVPFLSGCAHPILRKHRSRNHDV